MKVTSRPPARPAPDLGHASPRTTAERPFEGLLPAAPRFPGDVPPSQPVRGFADPLQARAPTQLVVFGATGDLMRRLLVPSLLKLTADGALPGGSSIVGVAPQGPQGPETKADFEARVRAAAKEFGKIGDDAPELEQLTAQLDFQHAAFEPGDMAELAEQLRASRRAGQQPLLYLALPPQVLPTAIASLKAAGLLDVKPGEPPAKLILEKPFGHDLESAKALRDALATALEDPTGTVRWQDRVLLIDHYLGKPAVNELIDLRFGPPTPDEPWNGALESMFNAEHIAHVEVQAEESVDIGSANRGAFMEAVGAFRDMFQSHLQQLTSVLVMERPDHDTSFDQAQAQALMQFRCLSPAEVLEQTVRGQYSEGTVSGKAVQAYRAVSGVAADSTVETFFAVRTESRDPRWHGVPFSIWSGKAMVEKETSIRIDFKKLSPELLARVAELRPELAAELTSTTPAALQVSIDPEPSFVLELGGHQVVLKAPESFDSRLPHQRLLEDAMDGKTDLFVSPEEAIAQWTHAQRVLDAWRAQPGGPVLYAAGSLPEAAASFMNDDEAPAPLQP